MLDGLWNRLQISLREWRHSRCFMSPVAAAILLAFLVVSLVGLVLTVPTLVLGFLLSPLLHRFSHVIEFLYPTALGRWLHLTLLKGAMNQIKKSTRAMRGQQQQQHHDKNRGYHSRALEQRLVVVPGRVYLHPLPQWLDNLGYLVVCIPPLQHTGAQAQQSQEVVVQQKKQQRKQQHAATTSATTLDYADTTEKDIPINRIVAFVVDCGQADSVLEQVQRISELHYSGRKIQIQAILSTHKHHDHTGGNQQLLAALETQLLQEQSLNSNSTTATTKKILESVRILVAGGAVERVPCCNYPLKDGDYLPLPKFGTNDMNALLEVEAVATPGHTRGSLTYILRPKQQQQQQAQESNTVDVATRDKNALSFVFTGDTLFSGGNGVPFEADVSDRGQKEDDGATFGILARQKPAASSVIRATAGNYAMERCTSEILARCLHPDFGIDDVMAPGAVSDRVLIFPGHEYTHDLLFRQFSPQASGEAESCRWKNFAPAYFFETVSQYYVSSHRRALPHSSGKLLNAPTSLRRELLVNSQLRLLRKRGEMVVRAIALWHEHFAKDKGTVCMNSNSSPTGSNNSSTSRTGTASSCFSVGSVSSTSAAGSSSSSSLNKEERSTDDQWNLNASDVDRPVFTTLYSAELDALVSDLDAGATTPADAAQRLRDMRQRLFVPTIARRPIPDTLPSDRAMCKALLGLVLLGSPPAALTLSDAQAMKLPPPMAASNASHSDAIQISKSRLVSVLYWLGLLTDDVVVVDSQKTTIAWIEQLWKETREYSDNLAMFKPNNNVESTTTGGGGCGGNNNTNHRVTTYDAVDVEVEVRNGSDDLVSLGALRWIIYGVPQQPPPSMSWLFGKFCMPCSSSDNKSLPTMMPEQKHPVESTDLKQHTGELVRHDISACPLCQSAAGLCPEAEHAEERTDQLSVLATAPSTTSTTTTAVVRNININNNDRPFLKKSTSTASYDDDPDPSLDEMAHVTTLNALGLLREARSL